MSIRVRPGGKRTRYRIVDEYEEEFPVSPGSSSEPLSLMELINLIDCGRGDRGLALDIVKRVFQDGGGSVSDCANFVQVSSLIYPDLAKHYWFVFQHWALTAAGTNMD